MKIFIRYFLIILALLAGLYLYFMYRSQDTVINICLAKLGLRNITFIMDIWNAHYPIPQWCMYSLPGGLWVFAATLLAKRLYFNIKRKEIKLKYLPLIFVVLIECVQLLGVTDGMYDTTDLIVSMSFCLLALIIPFNENKINMYKSIETYFLILAYLLVFLSDIWV